MKIYGVTGLEHECFIFYLNNRRQFCKINGTSSQLKEISCGVPKGSSLGPLLLLIDINDRPFSPLKSNISMYANDTAIPLSSKNVGELQNDLNLDLLKMRDWLHATELSLNVAKTQSRVVGSTPNIRKIERRSDGQLYFSTGELKIETTNYLRYLGVQLDSQLNWDKHIDIIKTKVNRALGLIKYRMKCLPPEILNKMYRGIIERYLRYCCSIWGCYSESRISTLRKIQNRAARIVTIGPYYVSAAPIIQDLGWSTINDLIRKETAMLTYESLNLHVLD